MAIDLPALVQRIRIDTSDLGRAQEAARAWGDRMRASALSSGEASRAQRDLTDAVQGSERPLTDVTERTRQASASQREYAARLRESVTSTREFSAASRDVASLRAMSDQLLRQRSAAAAVQVAQDRLRRSTVDLALARRQSDTSGLLRAERDVVAAVEAHRRALSRLNTAERDTIGGTGLLGRVLNGLRSGFDRASSGSGLFGRVLGQLKIPAVAAALGIAASALSAATAGVISFVGALAPGVGILAEYPTLILAAGQAVGTVKLALDGVSNALKVLNNAAATPQKVAAALAQLTPPAREFVVQLRAMKPRLDALRESAQGSLLSRLTEALRAANPLFPVAERGLRQMGTAIGNVAVQAARMVAAPLFRADLRTIMDANARTVTRLGTAGLSVVDAFRHIVVAAIPLTDWLTRLTEAWARNLDRQAAAARESGRLAAFFDRTRDVLTLVGRAVRDFGAGLVNVFSAGAATGRTFLVSLDAMAARFRAFTESTRGRSDLERFFRNAQPALREVALLVRDIVRGFAGLSQNQAIAPLIEMIRTQLLPAVLDLASGVSRRMGPALIDAATAFTRLVNVLSFSPLIAVVDVFAKLATSIATVAAQVPGLGTVVASLLAVGVALRGIQFVGARLGVAGLVTALVQSGRAAETASGGLLGFLRGVRGVQDGAGGAASALGGFFRNLLTGKTRDASLVFDGLRLRVMAVGDALRAAALSVVGWARATATEAALLPTRIALWRLEAAAILANTRERVANALATARANVGEFVALMGTRIGLWRLEASAVVTNRIEKLRTFAVDAAQAVRTFATTMATRIGLWVSETAAAVANRVAKIANYAVDNAQAFVTFIRLMGTRIALWAAETGTIIANTVALVAYRVASIATAVATRALAAAMFVLDAAMDANPIGLLVLALAGLVVGLVEAYRHSATFRAIVGEALHVVAAGAELLGRVFSVAFHAIRTVVADVTGVVHDHLRLLATLVLLPVAPLALLATHWRQVWAGIRAVVSGIVRAVTDRVRGLVSLVLGEFRGIERIAGIVGGAFAAAGRAVASGVSGIVRQVADIGAKVVAAVGNAGQWLYQAGRDLVQGFLNGITAAGSGGGFVGTVKRILVEAPINAIKSALGIFSPSRVTYGLGRDTAQGFANGLLDGAQASSRAAAENAREASDAFRTNLRPGVADFAGPITAQATAVAGASRGLAQLAARSYLDGFARADVHTGPDGMSLAILDQERKAADYARQVAREAARQWRDGWTSRDVRAGPDALPQAVYAQRFAVRQAAEALGSDAAVFARRAARIAGAQAAVAAGQAALAAAWQANTAPQIQQAIDQQMSSINPFNALIKQAPLSFAQLRRRMISEVRETAGVAAAAKVFVQHGITRPVLDELLATEQQAPGTMQRLVRHGLVDSFINEANAEQRRIRDATASTVRSQTQAGLQDAQQQLATAMRRFADAEHSAIRDALRVIAASPVDQQILRQTGINARQLAAAMVNGFAHGITNMASIVDEAVASMVTAAKRSAMHQMQAESPSRDFAEIGGFASQGFALGLARHTSKVQDAARKMVSASLAAAREEARRSPALTLPGVERPTVDTATVIRQVEWPTAPPVSTATDQALAEIRHALRTVPQTSVPSTAKHETNFYGGIHAANLDDALRKADRSKRLAASALGGDNMDGWGSR